MSTFIISVKSSAYLVIGPTQDLKGQSLTELQGTCPSKDTANGVGLWAKIPLYEAGNLKDPALSEPSPTTEAAEAISAA